MVRPRSTRAFCSAVHGSDWEAGGDWQLFAMIVYKVVDWSLDVAGTDNGLLVALYFKAHVSRWRSRGCSPGRNAGSGALSSISVSFSLTIPEDLGLSNRSSHFGARFIPYRNVPKIESRAPKTLSGVALLPSNTIPQKMTRNLQADPMTIKLVADTCCCSQRPAYAIPHPTTQLRAMRPVMDPLLMDSLDVAQIVP